MNFIYEVGGVAQSAEQRLFKPWAAGSSPAALTSLRQGFGRQATLGVKKYGPIV